MKGFTFYIQATCAYSGACTNLLYGSDQERAPAGTCHPGTCIIRVLLLDDRCMFAHQSARSVRHNS